MTTAAPTITPRDLRFGRAQAGKGAAARRWWLAGDAVASCWHLALSATFPRGEAFFIEAVKAHREGAPPALEAEIRAFVIQEVNHTREHLAFNRAAVDAGYDLSRVDARLTAFIDMTNGRPVILNLASTIALEHFTAIFAHDMLHHPEDYEGADPLPVALWRWHAIEEIEHKGVAFDTWLHATRNWNAWRRWWVRSLMMVRVSQRFIRERAIDTCDLLAQDGLRGPRAWARLFAYLWLRPGVLRRVAPAWLGFFRPSFHPWQKDDRALVCAVEPLVRAALERADSVAKAPA